MVSKPTVNITWQGGWVSDAADSGTPVDVDGEQRTEATPEPSARHTQDPDPPWTLRRIRLHYGVAGRGLGRADVAEAIRRSEEERCSVASSIRPMVAIESSFELGTA